MTEKTLMPTEHCYIADNIRDKIGKIARQAQNERLTKIQNEELKEKEYFFMN